MVTIRTKKIAIAPTPTPPIVNEKWSQMFAVLAHRQRNWRWRLLLKCIARHVFNNPLFHFIVRHQLLNHMSQHMHDVIPGSGGNTIHQAIITGVNEEYIKISGSS